MTGLSYVFPGTNSGYSHSYTYTPGGSLLTRSEGDGGTNTFGYDGANQLVSEVRSGSSVPFTHGYTYDHNGNRLTQTQNGNLVQSFTYNGHDVMSTGIGETPAWDLNGNETGDTLNGQHTTYTYDDEDRLTSATLPDGHTDSYTYNGLGLRLTKSDPSGYSTYFTDGTSPASDVLSDNFSTFTPGISETKGTASGYASLFYLADASGNSRGLLDGSQSVTDGYNWDAFGTLVSRFGSSGTGYAWGEGSGYQTDADTGLKLLGHRYYDTRIGRFLTQDPAGSGSNWYAYADNSPTNEVDPEGLAPMDGPGSSPVGSPGYMNSAESGSAGAMEEFGLNWQRHTYVKDYYQTPGVSHVIIGTYWTPDVGEWVDQNVTFGLVSASARDWDSHPGKAHWELAGASALVVATAFTAARAGLAGLAKSACFTAGTPVQTEKGTESIQDIHAGELVATRSLETNQTEYRNVVRTFKHLAHDTVTVKFADAKTGKLVDTLTATPEHPFYALGQGMTALGKLGIGTLVVTRAGPPVVVRSLVRHHSAAGVAVYNIEVEGYHTYFVGNIGEWVHNNCIADAIANGHAFAKHVLLRGEFKNVGVGTVQQFADHIADVMQNGTVRSLSNGRTAFWGDSSGSLVIHDPGSADLGTAFQPTNGISYFNNLH